MRLDSLKRLLLVICVFFLFSCKNSTKSVDQVITQTPIADNTVKIAPAFLQDSAYFFIKKQVDYGPRVPGTKAHNQCAAWLVAKFNSYKLEVIEQDFKATTYDGKIIPSKNIIASYNPLAQKRIIIASHWDSRPMADKEPGMKKKAIDGANDGASGVGVILEMARLLSTDSIKIGVDFILFDSEDWGASEDFKGSIIQEYDGWCLGSAYWAKNLHKPGYTAYFGVLLDMVGAKNATFLYEGVSMQIAPKVVSDIWSTASQIGFGQFFINKDGGQLIDDHVPVIQYAKIPMVDIIDLRQSKVNPNATDFFEYHHTTKDNMAAIDKNTLKAVGQVLLQVIYNQNIEN